MTADDAPLTLEDLNLADDDQNAGASPPPPPPPPGDGDPPASPPPPPPPAADAKWFDGFEDADLKTVAEGFESPADAVKALVAERNKPDNWRDGITDDNLKNVAGRFNSPSDMAKAIVDLRTQNSQAVTIPGEGASDEDVAKFRKQMGVPEDVSGYEVRPAEGQDELPDSDKAVIEQIAPVALKYNVPKAAFEGMVSELLEGGRKAAEERAEQVNAQIAESEAALRKKWGGDYDANLNLGKRAADTFAEQHGQDFADLMNVEHPVTKKRLGDHPVIMELMADYGRAVAEGGAIPPTEEEVADIQSEIDKLNKEVPPGSTAYKTPAHQDKLRKLYEKVAGTGNIVGTGQRTA